MEEQAKRIVEKHTKLMGVEYGLRIDFFLNGTSTYHGHWVCELKYREDDPLETICIEKPTIQELLDTVENEIDRHLTVAG